MNTGPLIAEIAGLVGEPARATMLSALLDGRALTATELAYAARVTPKTASAHLANLAAAGLVAPIRAGRYRYFRLASPTVAEMLDGIMAVALEHRPRYRPLSRQARELSAARICYDHLAGRLSVDLTDSLITHAYIVLDDEAAEITQAGTRFLSEFGIDLSPLSSKPRHLCRLCLYWTEGRPRLTYVVVGDTPRTGTRAAPYPRRSATARRYRIRIVVAGNCDLASSADLLGGYRGNQVCRNVLPVPGRLMR